MLCCLSYIFVCCVSVFWTMNGSHIATHLVVVLLVLVGMTSSKKPNLARLMELYFRYDVIVVIMQINSANQYPLQYYILVSSHSSDECLHHNSFLATCTYGDMSYIQLIRQCTFTLVIAIPSLNPISPLPHTSFLTDKIRVDLKTGVSNKLNKRHLATTLTCITTLILLISVTF